MRCDRGTTLATILVLFCCFGGNVGTGTITTHQVLVATVACSSTVVVVEVRSPSRHDEAYAIWLPGEVEGNLLPLVHVAQRHNLPPPTGMLS